jgi:NAD(P)-dependent dehydrogenase (short-subunit alcohol dehydrogenase family)
MDLKLKDHVVIVTGGASGIGRATALAFATEGARVAVWDLPDHAQRAAAEISAATSIRAAGMTVDIADESAVNLATSRTLDAMGRIDHLVHAAAIGSGKFGFPFTNLKPEDWPRVVQVNVMGMVHVAHAIAPHLIERKAGSMVFVASVAGQIGSQTDPPYSASKAANINFAQCVAKDVAPHGVRVNTVCPGMVQTPLNRSVWQAWHDQAPAAERLSYEEWSERKIRVIVPLGKWQTPEAIADMIVFLSSDRAAHVTGQTINVDGGFVMHW